MVEQDFTRFSSWHDASAQWPEPGFVSANRNVGAGQPAGVTPLLGHGLDQL
jgi:hypothetical protein